MSIIPDEAFSTEVLDKELHEPLIKDIQAVARSANIPQSMLWTSMGEHCSLGEIEYVKNLRNWADQGKYGLAYIGRPPKGDKSVPTRMHLVAAACVRNYINAKVISLQSVIAHLRKDSLPSPTVLLIPDFCVGHSEGGKVPEWIIHGLLSMLYDRQSAGLQTFLYVKSSEDLKNGLGSAFVDHIIDNFTIVEFGCSETNLLVD